MNRKEYQREYYLKNKKRIQQKHKKNISLICVDCGRVRPKLSRLYCNKCSIIRRINVVVKYLNKRYRTDGEFRRRVIQRNKDYRIKKKKDAIEKAGVIARRLVSKS